MLIKHVENAIIVNNQTGLIIVIFYGGITMAFSKYYEDNCELTFDRIFGNSNFSTTGYANLDHSHYYKPDRRPETERDERKQHHEK